MVHSRTEARSVRATSVSAREKPFWCLLAGARRDMFSPEFTFHGQRFHEGKRLLHRLDWRRRSSEAHR